MEETLVRVRSVTCNRGPHWLERARGPNCKADVCFDQGRAEHSFSQCSQQPKAQGSWEGKGWTGKPLSTQTPTMVELSWARPLPAAPLL